MAQTELLKSGSCHCGCVKFEVALPEGLIDLARCNCSMCARRGAVIVPVSESNFQLISGKEKLSLYQFKTQTAEHFFCSVCGIYTHHRRRSNPKQFSVNVACLEGVNPFELGEIALIDGINHISDR